MRGNVAGDVAPSPELRLRLSPRRVAFQLFDLTGKTSVILIPAAKQQVAKQPSSK